MRIVYYPGKKGLLLLTAVVRVALDHGESVVIETPDDQKPDQEGLVDHLAGEFPGVLIDAGPSGIKVCEREHAP
jgi:predicted metallo-beta-lactamase superfamily hydrolase